MVNKMYKRSNVLKSLVVELYEVFANYGPIKDLHVCPAFYAAEYVETLKMMPLSQIDTKVAKKLLWEAKDLWPSPEIYKYFLPRILEVMSPPESEEDLFPLHLIEVLEQLDFGSWPWKERVVVYKFLKHTAPIIYPDVEELNEFNAGISSLVNDKGVVVKSMRSCKYPIFNTVTL